MKEEMPKIYRQFAASASMLEKHYRDVQDVEFTIERGKLWMLQTRDAKRTRAGGDPHRRRPREGEAHHAAEAVQRV